MPRTSASPRPVPAPGVFVVKKGSKILSIIAAGTPCPYLEHVCVRTCQLVARNHLPADRPSTVRPGDGQRTALGHCISRIHAQVDDGLLEQGRINDAFDLVARQLRNDSHTCGQTARNDLQ